ncbi:MAG: ATP-binding protein [Phycisphaerae bacterium]|nr:ATP-binding protein [Phycisphaerae bacterium]
MLPPWMRKNEKPAEPVEPVCPAEAASDMDVAPPEMVQAMGMEARKVTRQVKLPDGSELDEAARAKIRQAVSRHIADYKLTQKEVGRSIGRASNTISEVLAGTYKGEADAVLRQLNTWIEDDDRRRRESRPLGFYSTSVFETILFLSKYAKSNGRVRGAGGIRMLDASRIALGFGPAGCGKSIGAQALHADDPSSLLVRIDIGKATRQGLIRAVVSASGGEPRHNMNLNMDTLQDRLGDSGRLLIIDEGHRMDFGCCELIRDITDVCGIPCVVLATQEFTARLSDMRLGLGKMRYDQFASRVGMQMDLTRGIDGSGGTERPIFSLEDIRAIFRSNEVRLSKAAEEYFQAIACTPQSGMLRTCNNVFEKIVRGTRRQPGALIGVDAVREATRYTLFAHGTESQEIMNKIEKSLASCKHMASEYEARAVG